MSESRIKAAKTLQREFRRIRAFGKVKELSGLDIPQQSGKNLLALYNRLRSCEGLPDQLKQAITQEKKFAHDVLTPQEFELFKTLINTPILMNHVSHNAEAILNSGGYIYAQQELKRQGIHVPTHTPGHEGENEFTFFSYGISPQVKTVRFLGQGPTFIVNYDKLIQDDPSLADSFSTRPHLYPYFHQQTGQPLILKIESFSTTVMMRYQITHNPIVKYEREYIFKHGNNDIVRMASSFEEEISAGRNIKPYHALRTIEFIRCFEPHIRNYILSQQHNTDLIAEIFDSIFAPGSAEMHVPALLQIKIDDDVFKFKQPASSLGIGDQLFGYIYGNKYSLFKQELKKLSQQGVDVQSFETSFDSKKNMSLLNVAVLYDRPQFLKLLLKIGFNPDHEYKNKKQSMYLHYANRHALQDAIELGKIHLLDSLCNPPSRKFGDLSINYGATITKIDMEAAIATFIDRNSFEKLLAHYHGTQDELDQLLLVATYYSNIGAIASLISKGANPNKTHKRIHQSDDNCHLIPRDIEETPLLVAAEHGRVEAAVALIKLGADVNYYCREESEYYRDGIGDTALLTVIKAINYIRNEIKIFRLHGIDNPLYQKLPIPTMDDYIQLVKLFISNGANIYFANGKSENIISLLEIFLTNNKLKAVDKSYFQSLYDQFEDQVTIFVPNTKKFYSYSYNLITYTKEKNTYILAGNEQERMSKVTWLIPGGPLDYTQDSDMHTAAINIAGYQAGIDLTKAPLIQAFICRKAMGKRSEYHVQANHFKLNTDEFSIPTTMIVRRPVLPTRNKNSYLPKLINLQYVNIKNIDIKFVTFRGILFPICFYQEKQFDYISAVIIAKMCGHDIDLKKCLKLAIELNFRGSKLFFESKKNNDIATIKLLLQLGLHHFISFGYALNECIEKGKDEIARELLFNGITVHHDYLRNLFDRHYRNIACSESLIELLYTTHKDVIIENKYIHETFAIFIGSKGYEHLITQTIKLYPHLIFNCAEGAVRYNNLSSLKHILSLATLEEKTTIFNKGVSRNLDFYNKVEDIASFLEMTEFLITECQSHKAAKQILQQIGSEFARTVTEHKTLQFNTTFLRIIELAVKKFGLKDKTGHIIGSYYTLKRDKFKQEAALLLAIIRKIPVVDFFYSIRDKSPEIIDATLEAYCENSYIRRRILIGHYSDSLYNKDETGNTCLQRAVKRNSIKVVAFLLDTCFDIREFKIDTLDADGKTAYDNAIALGYFDIASLLRSHGTKSLLTQQVIDEHTDQTSLTDFSLVISTQSPLAQDNLAKTGDVDYATNISVAIEHSKIMAGVNYYKDDTKNQLALIDYKQLPYTFFHLMINAPRTGFAIKVDYLQKLKKHGCHIIITAIEFAKHNREKYKLQTLSYFHAAEHVIFLDDNDKKNALELAKSKVSYVVDKISAASVISVPPTINLKCITKEKNNSHIMCFGMIRNGKGFAHVFRLAELLRDSKDKIMKSKLIYVVGSVQRHKTSRDAQEYDATLYKILCQMYPTHKSDFFNKSPQELIDIFNRIKDSLEPALPIRLYLDVSEQELPKLFAQCKYAFYPAYRGVTLRNSSISNELAYGCIIYSHIGDITPSCLRKFGEYHDAMVLFDNSDYEVYAEQVYKDLKLRETGDYQKELKSYNQQTLKRAAELFSKELTLESVVDRHLAAYRKVMFWGKPREVTDSTLTDSTLTDFTLTEPRPLGSDL